MQDSDQVVVSIFVNPAQFGPREDYARYPRTLEADQALLASLLSPKASTGGSGACDLVLFCPRLEDLYPTGYTPLPQPPIGTYVEVLGGLGQCLEGAVRPHFFRGVATVVVKLLMACQPDQLWLGQKDAQQCVVLRRVIQDLLIPCQVKVQPTTREPDGLAMSSRNRYLSLEERQLAPILYRSLLAGERCFRQVQRSRHAILKAVQDGLTVRGGPAVEVQYCSLAHPQTLRELDQVSADAGGALLSAAIRLGETRLIDNVLLDCTL